MRRAARVALWASAGALVYAQAGYPLLLAALARLRGGDEPGDVPPRAPAAAPRRRASAASSSG